uniref:Uncharacterized protein n=1 Tax=Cajanus cajan TaxID=3821 RepID=A0A151SJB2_CAJCA|nr:hypothetical protein KK1_001079 [Cajanus cajan]
MGHMSTSCPAGARQTRSAPRGDRSTAVGRVFALIGAEASALSDLVKGKDNTGKDVMILFDSGPPIHLFYMHVLKSWVCLYVIWG